MQNLRTAEKERENTRDRVKLLVKQTNKDEGVVIEARDRERNSKAEAVGGIGEDMAELGKELERARDEVGTDGTALASAKAKTHTIASTING